MEPGQVLVVLLYLWLLIAVGIYGWRAYRRVVHNETRADRAARKVGATAEPGGGASGRDRPVGAPAPTEPAVPGSPPDGPSAPRATVAELVEGIALPCGLLPVVGDELDPYKVAFATSDHPADEVGEALAGELGRLGYAVDRKTGTEAVARRGEAVLQVRIVPDSVKGAAASTTPVVGTRVIAELST